MKKGILLASGIGVGAGLFYLLRSNRGRGSRENGRTGIARWENEGGKVGKRSNGIATHTRAYIGRGRQIPEPHPLDDHGTGQSEAARILKSLRDGAFDSSDEKLALALGRPTEEIESWTNGSQDIDGDAVIKARGIAQLRGVEVD